MAQVRHRWEVYVYKNNKNDSTGTKQTKRRGTDKQRRREKGDGGGGSSDGDEHLASARLILTVAALHHLEDEKLKQKFSS